MNARRLISHPSDKGRTLAHRQPRIVWRITCIGMMFDKGQTETRALQQKWTPIRAPRQRGQEATTGRRFPMLWRFLD
jgi:hypothetical protein